MFPERIAQAAADALESTPPLKPGDAPGKPGEIAVASAAGDSHQRIVAVMARDDDMKTADIVLTASEIEMATDLDLVLSSEESGLPFPLMFESELYGPVFLEQLKTTLSRLADEVRLAARRALASDGESLESFRTGTPLGGEDDSRRRFKSQELVQLDEIVAECRAWLTGEGARLTILDPGLLIPPATGSPRQVAEDQYLELLDALELMGGRDLEFPSELVALMGVGGFLEEIARWRIDFGLDTARILTRFRFTRQSVDLIDDQVEDVLVSFLRHMARSGTPTVDIRSSRRCWRRGEHILVVGSEQGICRARALLKEAA